MEKPLIDSNINIEEVEELDAKIVPSASVPTVPGATDEPPEIPT